MGLRLTFFLLLISFFSLETNAQRIGNFDTDKLPVEFQRVINNIRHDSLGNEKGIVNIRKVNDHVIHVDISFLLDKNVSQNDWQVNIKPSFKPTFNWAPHLTPTDKNIIAQHVFRSPALIVSDSKQVLIAIPDLDILNRNHPVQWYMDMDAERNILTLGMSESKVTEHVIFERNAGAVYPQGKVEFGFYLLRYNDKETLNDPFMRTTTFLWNHWGRELFEMGNPIRGSLMPYVKHTYDWAFKNWKDQVWQQFQLDGKTVGAPTFIVNVTQSPDYPGLADEREFRSIWNQAWFSSLRSASGLYRYARRTKNDSLMKKALMTKELALSFPKKKGFFYGLIGTDMKEIEINGKKYNRSEGWNHDFWGNSNRNPYTTDPKTSPFHILDMSWTSLWMLRWYEELEKDKRLLNYVEDYADSLLKIQFANGFFPTWLDLKTLRPLKELEVSPETSVSVSLLLKLYKITGEEKFRSSALKAMNAVMDSIVLQGRWEDFETYWSCSRIGSKNWVGHKVARNNMYKQNNFSMFWTAEALLDCYHITHDNKYLAMGRRTLDELLMTQASWQPFFIPIKALGGFGVMNADGEWNDARQSLFAELIIKYGLEFKDQQYIQRGLAAMRASFVMMYCPENPETKKQWEDKWPFFGPKDYGFMMENYGHGGENNSKGLGIGEFTIYDWGNGAASEAYNRLLDHFGEKFVDGNGSISSIKKR